MAGDEGANGVVIRPAVYGDLPQMLEMGERFFGASGYSDVTRYHRDSMRRTFEGMISSPSAVVLVVEHKKLIGMAGALIYPWYFNAEELTSQELFWWVDQEHRGRGVDLLESLIASVNARGAKSLSMIALDRLHPEKVGGIYERRGFRPSERSYIKKL